MSVCGFEGLSVCRDLDLDSDLNQINMLRKLGRTNCSRTNLSTKVFFGHIPAAVFRDSHDFIKILCQSLRNF